MYKDDTGALISTHQFNGQPTGSLSYTFTGLVDGTTYYVVLQVQQGIYNLNCTTDTAIPTSSMP